MVNQVLQAFLIKQFQLVIKIDYLSLFHWWKLDRISVSFVKIP